MSDGYEGEGGTRRGWMRVEEAPAALGLDRGWSPWAMWRLLQGGPERPVGRARLQEDLKEVVVDWLAREGVLGKARRPKGDGSLLDGRLRGRPDLVVTREEWGAGEGLALVEVCSPRDWRRRWRARQGEQWLSAPPDVEVVAQLLMRMSGSRWTLALPHVFPEAPQGPVRIERDPDRGAELQGLVSEFL